MKSIPEKLNKLEGLKLYEEKEEYYIYFLCDLNDVVYIGRTDSFSLNLRLNEHRMNDKIFKECYYITMPEKHICIKREKELILSIKPKYNIQNLYEQLYPIRGAIKGKYKIKIDLPLLKYSMEEKDLSIAMLAKKANISPGSIYYILNKESASQLTIKKIAKVLKLKIKDLKQALL